MKNNKKKQTAEISRKEAISKKGNTGKYPALPAVGTYLILSPQKAQAQSADTPGTGF
jgi:hypothetical protein